MMCIAWGVKVPDDMGAAWDALAKTPYERWSRFMDPFEKLQAMEADLVPFGSGLGWIVRVWGDNPRDGKPIGCYSTGDEDPTHVINKAYWDKDRTKTDDAEYEREKATEPQEAA